MIIVTGGAGFIGSNIVKQLNAIGRRDIIVIDELTDGKRFKNLSDLNIADYLDADLFLARINAENFNHKITAIFHQGACSSTTEWNGKYMMNNNYEYSKSLLHYCLKYQVPFIYASSAAVYGNNTTFAETRDNEAPLNVYGYSKMLFDHYVRPYLAKASSQIVGLRYFNVYGPRESHKGSMASVAFHLNNQLKTSGIIKLFQGTDGYTDGEQRRDFVYVDDVANVNLWFWHNPRKKGIFNVGTGHAQPFNDVANAVLRWHGKGKMEYIPFPEHLQGHYQSYTQADISALRQAGYDQAFRRVEEGVASYLDWLNG